MKSWVSSAAVAVVVWTQLASPAVRALGPGDTPPPIGLPDQRGKPVDLQELRGKVVVIDFWASWCKPCKKEMPVLEALHRRYGKEGLVVVGVNIDTREKKMKKFLAETPVTFRQVHDPKLRVASRYKPPEMPSAYLVGRDGTVRDVLQGFREEDARRLEAAIRELLEEAQTTPP